MFGVLRGQRQRRYGFLLLLSFLFCCLIFVWTFENIITSTTVYRVTRQSLDQWHLGYGFFIKDGQSSSPPSSATKVAGDVQDLDELPLNATEFDLRSLFEGAKVGQDGNWYPPHYNPLQANNSTIRVNAAFVGLVRNSEAFTMAASMKSLEQRFNHKYNYPYIFLNGEQTN